MATMRHRTFSTEVGKLSVTEHGEGPPALLWHSLFVDSRSWQRLVEELAAHRHLVLVDGPGHGTSADTGRRYDLTGCGRAAIEIIDATVGQQPVDWVGNAWGGHVGIVVASQWPERCRTLATSHPFRPTAERTGYRRRRWSRPTGSRARCRHSDARSSVPCSRRRRDATTPKPWRWSTNVWPRPTGACCTRR